MATKFYICTSCGNVVFKFFDSGVTLECCGQAMQEIVPLTNDSAMEKHLPVVECMWDGRIKVKVGSKPHPMTKGHYIGFIYLETEHGGQVRFLTPDDEPEAVFHLSGDKPVAVYEYCNVHGLWKKDLRTDRCPTVVCE
ncbi:MAG: desulfoferrodoxin [Bacteroidales bacterium]|nr:desulfoferrodoxin [Bacteroidales bacterium]